MRRRGLTLSAILLIACLIFSIQACDVFSTTAITKTVGQVTPTTSTSTMIATTTTTTSTVTTTSMVTTITQASTTTTTTSTSAGLPQLTVHYIDVGQGDSILIDLDQTEILIDAGDRSPGVITYLHQYVDGPLEVMVATHMHADHIGGLIQVLANFDVGEIWHNGDTATSKTYADFMAGVESEGALVNVGRNGDVVTTGALTFRILSPINIEGTSNNNSIVLYLKYGDVDFLFTGDAEVESEEKMLEATLPDIDILKVGHHASRTASSPGFLAAITPEVAIYMCKEGNSYEHPHQETIQALTTIGAQIYGTETYGTIVVTTDGQTYSVLH